MIVEPAVLLTTKSIGNKQVRSTSAGFNIAIVEGLCSSKRIQLKAWDFMGYLMKEDENVSISNENFYCKFCLGNEKTRDILLLGRIYSTMDTTSTGNWLQRGCKIYDFTDDDESIANEQCKLEPWLNKIKV